jgi:two-component system, sensor histidine kinase
MTDAASRTPLVLVVDDNDASRFAKTQIVRRAGFDFVEAATGSRALELIRSRPVDIVLLDINLPDMSGIEVCSRIKGDEVLAMVPVLQVSATAVADADRVRGLEGGADAYLIEPAGPEVLTATLNALMRARRAELGLKAALERERDARDAAESANGFKDEFLAKLSHELRTPLNAMVGWIAQLRAGTLDEPGRDRALQALERSARAQWRLVNELLDSASIAKGKLQLETGRVDLEAIAAASIESVRDEASRRNVELIPQTRSVVVIGDGPRLQQVVTNLLNNAIRFTPSGGRVVLTVDASKTDAVIRVQDTGAGIDPELLPHVFEQFRQGDASKRHGHSGLGLGLAIAEQLIQMHGGSILAESGGLDCGAIFTVHLPLAQAEPTSGQSAPSASQNAAPHV